ncbi:hypothetical protein [Wenxinia marina]|uniref:Uncharacterized protein n=1 Tax=Wenxinia marina DSM 24838 TaxID=1123501 RepID=A0A0D0Q9X5_9RHOB|nr:hypothetical protein [Wenxinia marina]KIQ67818.1 hypothetical protein Wenmar_03547 [Wenxinia marina DSM 24838]GGL74784.1 hypothetical protein GCM10011392_31800 [Wenxinia marina]
MRALARLVALAALAGPAAAQEADAPLSAIDWLSRSVETAPPAANPAAAEPPVSGDATSPEITVTPLDQPTADPVGLLPPSVTGLPASLWSRSSEAALTELVRGERIETLPAMQDLISMLMLAEADPPMDAGPGGALFLARVDKLLDLGALEPAAALLEAAGPVDDPERFRRWFDVSLLLGTEDAACAAMRDRPTIAPTLPARVFCLARQGDWNAAALTLNTAIALGDVTPEEEALLTRFLDVTLDETAFPLPVPERVTPLMFRLYEAIGEALPTADLPRAFAHADLREITAWRLQIEAAERLARNGAVSQNVLFDLYTRQSPGASGGVWDRAAAIQRFEAALQDGPAAVAEALPEAWAAMEAIRAEVPFAQEYAAALAGVPLTGEAAALAHRIALLSPDYEAAALARPADDGTGRLLNGVARGDVAGLSPSGPAETAIVAAFAGAEVPQSAAELIEAGRLGEALLRAGTQFNQGLAGDTTALTGALATLRAVGLEDLARRAALQVLILDRAP